MKENILIVGGGSCQPDVLRQAMESLGNPEHVRVFTADRGTLFAAEAGLVPDLAVGDFDSVSDGERQLIFSRYPAVKLNPEKDDTDLEHVLRLAVREEPEKILICGGTGTRLDHTFANIHLLKMAFDAGIDAKLLDRHNRIRIIRDQCVLKKADLFGKYVSLFPLYGSVSRLTLRGFRYDTRDLEVSADVSRCVSNEAAAEECSITCSGYMILMETCD